MTRNSAICWLVVAALGLIFVSSSRNAAAQGLQGRLPEGFVYLRQVDPSIRQDIRYAGADNFIGRPLAGYEVAECILRQETADALRRVQLDLATRGLGLKVYDCYRPQRAVRMMTQWVASDAPDGPGKRFFPRVEKRNLLAGYISANSLHSTGIAVDLTLVPIDGTNPAPSPAASGCDAAGADGSIDMGTGYDCLDPASHTDSWAISFTQRRARTMLASAMAKRGFAGYRREWWHFTYSGVHAIAQHDFPIRRR